MHRSPVIIVILTIIAPTIAHSQNTIPVLIGQLGSPDWSQRSNALDQLPQVPGALQNAQVESALISTLNSENQLIVAALRQSGGLSGLSGQYGEGYSEYYANLLGAVATFANFSDPNTVQILTHGAYAPQSSFAGQLASHADAILPSLLDLSNSDVAMIRQVNLAFIGNIIHIFKPTVLNQAGVSQLMQVLTKASSDPDPAVRSQGATALQNIADVNADGRVDCSDLSIVKASFGKRTGQPGFDARADVNLDGIVDIRDQALVSQRLPVGTRCQ